MGVVCWGSFGRCDALLDGLLERFGGLWFCLIRGAVMAGGFLVLFGVFSLVPLFCVLGVWLGFRIFRI